MSFIAGYILRSGRLDATWVRQRLADFPILSGEEPNSYENGILAIPSGHLLWKFRKNFPLPPTISTDDDNILLTLGFHLPHRQRQSGKDLIVKCRRRGAKILEHIEGEFVSIYSEGAIGALHIVNDRFASRPIFLLERRCGIYFSSNFMFLQYFIQNNLKYDITGCLQLFSYGHTIGKRTIVNDIKRLPPANHLILTPQEIKTKRYWAYKHVPDEALISDSYSEKVFDAFKTATQSRAKLFGSGIIALSGGLDSRLLSGAMPSNSRFTAFTFIDSTESISTPEVNAASAVGRVLGLKHKIKCLEPGHISTVAHDVVRLTGGLIPLHHPSKVMKYILEMKQNNQFFLLGGAPGNNLSGSFIPSIKYLDPKNLDSCMSHYRAQMNFGGLNELKALLLSVFRDEIIESFLAESIREMDLSINSVRGPTAAHRIAAWQMCWGFPAFSANSPIHNHPDVMEAFAHLDYTYCDLLSKLPATWLYKRNFYEYMIYMCLPELRHIIYANTGKPINGNFQTIDLDTVSGLGSSFWEDIYSKLGKKIILKQRLSRVKQAIARLWKPEEKKAAPPFLYHVVRKDDRLLSDIVESVHSYPDLRLIFNPTKCLRLINGVKMGQKQTLSFKHDTELIGCLASMCYSVKNFNSI